MALAISLEIIPQISPLTLPVTKPITIPGKLQEVFFEIGSLSSEYALVGAKKLADYKKEQTKLISAFKAYRLLTLLGLEAVIPKAMLHRLHSGFKEANSCNMYNIVTSNSSYSSAFNIESKYRLQVIECTSEFLVVTDLQQLFHLTVYPEEPRLARLVRKVALLEPYLSETFIPFRIKGGNEVIVPQCALVPIEDNTHCYIKGQKYRYEIQPGKSRYTVKPLSLKGHFIDEEYLYGCTENGSIFLIPGSLAVKRDEQAAYHLRDVYSCRSVAGGYRLERNVSTLEVHLKRNFIIISHVDNEIEIVPEQEMLPVKGSEKHRQIIVHGVCFMLEQDRDSWMKGPYRIRQEIVGITTLSKICYQQPRGGAFDMPLYLSVARMLLQYQAGIADFLFVDIDKAHILDPLKQLSENELKILRVLFEHIVQAYAQHRAEIDQLLDEEMAQKYVRLIELLAAISTNQEPFVLQSLYKATPTKP